MLIEKTGHLDKNSRSMGTFYDEIFRNVPLHVREKESNSPDNIKTRPWLYDTYFLSIPYNRAYLTDIEC